MKIIPLIFIIIAFIAIRHGINRTERNECLTWQKQDQQYSSVPNYGNPQWAKDQCQNYSIILK